MNIPSLFLPPSFVSARAARTGKAFLAALLLATGAMLPNTVAQTMINPGNQALLAGWDFDAILTSSLPSPVRPRYSDVYGNFNQAAGVPTAGGIYFNGQFGSDNWGTVAKISSGDINRDILTRSGSDSTFDLGGQTGGEGSANLNNANVGTAAMDEFSIQLHLADGTNSFKDLQLSLWGRDVSGVGVKIDWFYTIDDGATKVPTALSSIFTSNVFSNSLVDFSSLTALNGKNDVYLIGKVSETSSSAILNLDNIGAYAFAQVVAGAPPTAYWKGGPGAWAGTGTDWRDAAGTAPVAWNSGTAVFRQVAGAVPGTVTVDPAGLVFTGVQFTTSGYTVAGGNLSTSIASAPVQVGGSSSMVATISAPIVGTGGIEKTGPGTLTLAGNNTYAGNTTVTTGTLLVTGNNSGAAGPVSVASGATLGGTGTVGNTTVQSGGILLGNAGSVLTLASVNLNATSQVNVTLGAPATTGLFNVTGALTLDGVLNVASTTGFGAGLYRIFDYTGILINNTLQAGLVPTGFTAPEIQTSVANQVNIVFATTSGNNTSGNNTGGNNTGGNNTGGNNTGGNNTGGTGSGGGTVAIGARPIWIGGDGFWNASADSTSWKTVDGTTSGAWDPGLAIFQGSPGTVIVSTSAGAVSMSGIQFAVDGYTITGGTLTTTTERTNLRVGDGTSAGSSMVGRIATPITGSGGVEKNDLGTLILTGANTYAGGTFINAGTLQLGTAGTTGSIIGGVSNNGSLIIDRSDAVTLDGIITGNGTFTQAGAGTTTLTANNTYSGNTTIAAGSLQVGAGGTTGRIGGNVTNNANLTLNRSDALTMSGVISGTGTVTQAGSGVTTLTGNNTYTGGTTIGAGTLQLGAGGTTGDITGSVVNNGTLAFNRSDALSFDGVISGTGSVAQNGRGTTTLSAANTYTGATAINAGTLLITGNQSAATGAVTVATGATLGGTGTTGGAVTVQDGGAISAPVSGALTVGGLTLNPAAGANFVLGAPGTIRTLQVNGALTLDGRYQLSDGGGLALGTYRLIDYTGALTDSTIQFGAAPVNPGDLSISTATANQVNLTFANTVADYWIGGAGTWSAAPGGTSFEKFDGTGDGAWQSRVATFRGTAGAVTVDNTAGAVNFTGAQFTTSGYTVTGGTLTTTTAETLVQVGNGGTTGASSTATLSSTIAGTGGITKVDQGTLVLAGNNTYTGATTVAGGTLLVTGNQTAATGTVTVDSGARLGGTGTVGSVIVRDGGTLLGTAGSTLTTGALTLSPNARFAASLGAPLATGLLQVNGALTLDGFLDVTNTGGFGPGLYRLINYTGALTDSGLQVGMMPAGAFIPTVQTSVANQINLLVDVPALPLWAGGSGTWSAGTSSTSWGSANGQFQGAWDGGMAIFQGAPGIITIDTTGGPVSATGIQFAANGFSVSGGDLTTSTASTALRVGDGTATGSSMTGTIASAITGTGGVAKTDLGTLILSGANTYTGGTTVTAGTLQIGAGGTAGSVVGDIANNATLAFNRSDAFTVSGAISGTGSVVNRGTGTTVLTATNTYSGGTTINSGTLAIGSGGTTGSIAGNITNNGTLSFNRSDGVNFAGVITGTGSVVNQGAGTTTLTAANTYTGNTTIAAGTLQLGNGGASGSVTGNIVNNATLAVNRSNDITLSGVISGSGSVVQLGSGTTILTGTNTYSGGTTVSAGKLQIGAGGTSGSVAGNIVTTAAVVVLRSDALTMPGVISGTGSFMQAGNGTTTLTATNTYTGGTMIEAGTLQLGAGGTTGTILGDIANSGSLAINRSDAVTIAGAISGSGSLTQAGGGTTTLTGASSHTGGTTISAGTLRIGAGGVTGSLAGNVTNNGTLTINRSDAVTLNGVISGNGTFTQAGTGTTTLTATNTHTGGTTISAGTLAIGTGGTAGAIAGNIANNGNLAFNRSDEVTFAGVISGTGSVAQNGAGATVLTAANTYTGSTTINAGTLQLGGGGTSGSVAGGITNHGTLALNRSDAVVLTNVISGTGAVVKLGNGTTTLAGANTYTGGTTINGGVLEVLDNSNLGGSGGITLNGGTLRSAAGFTINRNVALGSSGGTLDTGANILVVQGAVTGSGNLTKTGTGQLTLTGGNSFAGTTTISQGAIALNASNLAATNIAANGRLSGNGSIRGNLANAGQLSPGASAGSINVTGNFSQAATGTLNAELASATSFDTIVVTGNASLGGTLAVSGLNGYVPAAGQTFPIITATGTISGTFASLSSPWANISPMLRFEALYSPKNVRLSMTQLPFAGVSGSPSQVAFGAGIDGAIALGAIPNLQKALNALPNHDRVREALYDLSPLRFERWYQQAVYNAGAMIRTAETRLDQVIREPRGSVWTEVVGRSAKFDELTDGYAGKSTATGITVGADARILPDVHVGLMFGYTGESLRLDDAGSTTDVQRYSSALFARFDPAPWYVETVVGATHAELDNRRIVRVPGVAGIATSETNSQDQYASVRMGYTMAWNFMKLTPYIAADYVRWSADPTTEVGAGDASLHLLSQRSDSLASRVGFTMAFPYLAESVSFIPRIDLGWRHEFRDTRPEIRAELGGSPFIVQGGRASEPASPIGLGAGANTEAEKPDGITGGLGLDVTFGSWMTSYLRVSTEWSTAASKAVEARAGTEFRF